MKLLKTQSLSGLRTNFFRIAFSFVLLFTSSASIATAESVETVQVQEELGLVPATTTGFVAPTALPIPSSINVLILALDEADLRSVRPSSIADIPALLDAANSEGESKTDESKAAPSLRAPKVPSNPLGEFPDFLLPPLPSPEETVEGETVEEGTVEDAPLRIEEIPGEIAYEKNPFRTTLAQQLPFQSTLETPNRRSPGRAQTAAAPLRRALIAEGVGDVLTAPLDGSTLVRVVNSGRLRLKSLDRLRHATRQLIESQDFGAEEKASRAARLQEIAAESASHIGLALNYRAVVVVAIAPGGKYSLLLVDTVNETSEQLVLSESGSDVSARDQKAMKDAARTIAGQLRGWAPFTPADREKKVESHLERAQEAIEEGQVADAENHFLQAIALDATDIGAYLALGDLLLKNDREAAAAIYERAAEIDKENGEVWARIATAYSLTDPVEWAQSSLAAEKALAAGYDSAPLRIAMAAAEFGRAHGYRRDGRPDQAEDTELRATRYLEKARELSPEDINIAAQADRLQAGYLLEQERYHEAAQTLGALAVRYPEDIQTQELYARALEGTGRHEEDLFAAWSRVWTLSGQERVVLEAERYTRITDGFDQRLFALARSIFSMTSGVATGTLPRESAQRQAARSHEEMKLSVAALQRIAPPAKRTLSDAHALRLFAADLMEQAADLYMSYLTDGSQADRSRGVNFHREAIERLNRARLSSQE